MKPNNNTDDKYSIVLCQKLMIQMTRQHLAAGQASEERSICIMWQKPLTGKTQKFQNLK